MSEKSHQNFLHKFASHQIPVNLSIRQLPKKIVSFVISILRQLPVKQQRLKELKPSELLLGAVGSHSLSPLVLNNLFSLMNSPSSRKTLSCPPLPSQSEKLPTLNQIKSHWFTEQSKPPCHMYLRPSGQTLGVTQDWTETVRLASSSKNNSKAIKIKTKEDKNKK